MDEFDGKKFTFWRGYFRIGNKMLHRIIWEKKHGKIPKYHVIHHKNGNKLNNSLENLECMTQAEHSKLHRLEESESLSCRMSKNSEKLHEWHRSEEGRKSMSERGRKQFEKRPVRLCICAECGKKFSSIHTLPTKFCSNNCISRDRRKSGKDNEERMCIICSTPFVINKYQLTKTCSKPCRAKHISNLKTKKILL